MKKAKIFFHPIDGTGSLTISWTRAPKGDAIEANKGSGVGFFSDEGSLLAVIFDEIKERQDHQTLEFDEISVEVTIKAGKVDYAIIKKSSKAVSVKRRYRKKSCIPK
jgi:hypothetical protein